jgi:hypothetical protein
VNPAGEDALTKLLKAKNPSSGNPFLKSTIDAATRPILENLTETLDRTLPGRFTQGGQFVQPEGSSAFDRAAAIATRGATQEIGDISSQIAFGAYEGDQNRNIQRDQTKVAAAGQLSDIQAQEVDTLIKNLQAQALPRLVKDLGYERGLAQFQSQVENLLAALGIGAAASRPVTVGTSQGSGTQVGLK